MNSSTISHSIVQARLRQLVALLVLGVLLYSPPVLADPELPPVPGPDLPAGQIITVAGGASILRGDPRRAALMGLSSVAVDPRTGTVYLTDVIRHEIYRIDAVGRSIEVFAGTGIAGFNGDGRSAADTWLHLPSGLAVHPTTGDVYVADTLNYRIRVIARDGSRVRTVAGSGVPGVPPEEVASVWPVGEGLLYGKFSGDGGPATKAHLNMPNGLVISAAGALFIADSANYRVRLVNLSAEPFDFAGRTVAAGAIATVAGNGGMGSEGDGGPAVEAQLSFPRALATTPQGDLLIVDMFNKRLRRVDRETGDIHTVLDTRPADPGSARQVWLPGVEGIAVDRRGRLFYSVLNPAGLFAGDPGADQRVTHPGDELRLPPRSVPGRMAIGRNGELLVVDSAHHLVHKVVGQEVAPFAGGGSPGEGVAATAASFSILSPLAVAADGDLYVGDIFLHSIRRVDAETGRLTSFAGNRSADGGDLRTPSSLLIHDNEMWVTDPGRRAVKHIDLARGARSLETIAGCGKFASSGDGGPAVEACLGIPNSVARHPRTGELYIVDTWFSRIRKIDRRGVITTVAGTGEQGFGGDGGPAISARLNWPGIAAFDASGNLYVSDMFNHRIRKIAADGTISTYAGTGVAGGRGDGGPADAAELFYPNGLAVDAAGNLYVADSNNHRVRKIAAAPTHRITSVAGNGQRGFSGDGGPAVDARLNVPRNVTLGPGGMLYIADSFNGRIWAVRVSSETTRTSASIARASAETRKVRR